MATIANPVTIKSLSAAEVTSTFTTDHKSADILLSEFDTSAGENSSRFWESSDRDGTDATDEDHSEAETEHSGIISGCETDVCTSHLGEVGSSSVEIESGTKGDDEAEQVSELPRYVLRPRRHSKVVSKLAKSHTVDQLSSSTCVTNPPSGDSSCGFLRTQRDTPLTLISIQPNLLSMTVVIMELHLMS